MEAIIDTLELAEKNNLSHSSVLETIRKKIGLLEKNNLDINNYYLKNFFINSRKRKYPKYNITQNGLNFFYNSKKYLNNEKYRYVYILTDGEFFKIGIAKNIKKRIDILQIGNPRKLEVLIKIYTKKYILLEKELHKFYSNKNILGEWFLLNNDILEHIHKNILTFFKLDMNDDYYDSLEIAKKTNIQHRHIVKKINDIKKLEKDNLEFIKVEYNTGNNRKYKKYLMNRNATNMLIMCLPQKKVLKFHLYLTESFNLLERQTSINNNDLFENFLSKAKAS